MYRILIVVIFLIFSCKGVLKPEDIKVDMKTEALNFSLQIIESIIKQDVITYKTFFMDSIYTLDGDGQFPLSEDILDERFASILYLSNIDSNTTMDDYNANYTPTIFTYDEFTEYVLEELNWELPKYAWITTNDYIFYGVLVENGIEIIWDDANVFLVSKIDNKWWYKASSG